MGYVNDESLDTLYITITLKPGNSSVSVGRDVMAKLVRELKQLRKRGYETEVYIRGAWYTGAGKVIVHKDLHLTNWRLGEDSIESPDLTGIWVPCYRAIDGPEIVLEGIRRKVHTHADD